MRTLLKFLSEICHRLGGSAMPNDGYKTIIIETKCIFCIKMRLLLVQLYTANPGIRRRPFYWRNRQTSVTNLKFTYMIFYLIGGWNSHIFN